jgi:hypothetical protein
LNEHRQRSHFEQFKVLTFVKSFQEVIAYLVFVSQNPASTHHINVHGVHLVIRVIFVLLKDLSEVILRHEGGIALADCSNFLCFREKCGQFERGLAPEKVVLVDEVFDERNKLLLVNQFGQDVTVTLPDIGQFSKCFEELIDYP